MSKLKITESGQPCRHCATPVEYRGHTQPKSCRPGGFWYARWLYCRNCHAMYMLESEKRGYDGQLLSSHPSHPPRQPKRKKGRGMRPCQNCGMNKWGFEFNDETRIVTAKCVPCGFVVKFPAKPKKNAGKVYAPPQTTWRPDDVGEGNDPNAVPWVE